MSEDKQSEMVRLTEDDLEKIYMRFVGYEGLSPRLFEDIAGCVMEAMISSSEPRAVQINEDLLKALKDTDRIIAGQLEIIEQRAKGDFLNKRPVVQSLSAHRSRIQKAIAAAEAAKKRGGVMGDEPNVVIDALQTKLDALEKMQKGCDNINSSIGGGMGIMDCIRYEQMDELREAIKREKARGRE